MHYFRRVFYFFVVMLLLLGCSSERTSFPRHQTLYVGGFQWSDPTTFNPLSANPAWPVTGDINLIYESLFSYNMLSGKLDPLLGKSYSFHDDSTLIIELQDSAYWSNGKAVTTADVLYTFEVHKKFDTDLHASTSLFDTIYQSGTNQITFKLSSEDYNPLAVKDVISTTHIIPRHVFKLLELWATRVMRSGSKGEEVSTSKIFSAMQEKAMDDNLIGSGPYWLQSFSNQKIVLQRNKNYWGNNSLYYGKKPAPKFIIHPLFKSNDKYNLALQMGQLDFTRTFFPMVGTKKDDGVGTWLDDEPYYIPGSIPSLVVNVGKEQLVYTPNESLKDPAFRQAMAAAIDYRTIRRIAIDGYASELEPGYILNTGVERKFFSEEDIRKYGVKYSPDVAREILKRSGYSWRKSDGILLKPNGKPVEEMRMTSPVGWTDWEIAVGIAVEGLRKIGIPIREKYVEESVYNSNLERGFFDLIMHTYQADEAASLPWSRFERTMSSIENPRIGLETRTNMGRYKNPRVDSLLQIIPHLYKNTAALDSAYRELNVIFMQDLPVIPLMYRPGQYYQFSTKHWENFPTERNWHAPPQDLMRASGVKALWGLSSVQKGRK